MKKESNYTALKIKILDIIRKSGPITKKEISRILNYNIGTITRIVNILHKKHNLIVESGKDTSESGRRPDLYTFNREIGYIVGIDIGSENIRVASARAGNVIGGGDWAQDRIVPDCMRAWSNDESVEIKTPTLQNLGSMF